LLITQRHNRPEFQNPDITDHILHGNHQSQGHCPFKRSLIGNRKSQSNQKSKITDQKTSIAYAQAGYEASVTNLSQVSLATDGIFSDGAALELATVSGSVASGMTATLSVAVAS